MKRADAERGGVESSSVGVIRARTADNCCDLRDSAAGAVATDFDTLTAGAETLAGDLAALRDSIEALPDDAFSEPD